MFVDELTIDIDLVTAKERLSVKTGDIKALELRLEPWGFTGQAELWMWGEEAKDDPFFEHFVKHDPLTIEVTLGIPEETKDKLSLSALVSSRSLEEQAFEELSDAKILVRRYTLSFEDRGAALWRQHYPSVLETDVTLKEEINRQLPTNVKVQLDWSFLEQKRALLCLALGGHGPSFYDFLLWTTDAYDGVFAYDYDDKSYLLASKKPAQGKEVKLRGEDVARLRTRLPAPPRASARVMNISTEASGTLDIDQDQAIDGVRRDVMVRSAVQADADDRKALEQGRLESPALELEVELAAFPSFALHPWRPISLQREFFASKLLGQGKSLRCQSVRLSAKASDAEGAGAHQAEKAKFEIDCTLTLESESDKVQRLPAFEAPRYPQLAEGTIRCEIGEDGDRSYMVYTDSETNQTFYKVHVPLWNKEVMVPFGPDFMPGHLYFPAYKDARALLALHFEEAELLRFLDWGKDVQLPVDSQGNHILFGKNKTSETSARHYYVDSKPVLSVQRIENGDIELLSMSDGTLVLETKEDASQKSGSSKFDVTAEVASARGKMTMEAKGAISGLSSGYDQSRGQLEGELDSATTQTKASLENMGGAINAKADEVSSQLEGAGAAVGERAAKLTQAAEESKAELEAAMKL